MKVICHFPKEEENLIELRKRVSKVHAETVINQLCRHSCPTEQKKKILSDLITYLK